MKIVLSALLALFLLGCSEDKATTNMADTQSVVADKTELVKSTVDEAAKAAEIVVKEATKEAETTAVEAQNVVQEVKATAEETIKENVSGADLFKACASCHGQKGEKPALGKSQIITGWSAAKVAAALHGYKDGTYGAAMKSVMKGHVSKLNDAQIQVLSDYISTL